MTPSLLAIFLLLAHFNLYAQFCETPIGFGRNATGGAAGSNYVVTNLNNSGTGSLRAGLESTSTLNITFAVSGTIAMTSDINIKSNKTVDGNGTYIRIRPFGFRIDNQNNIIVRNLHFDSDHLDHGGSGDAISISNSAQNIWIDHCTFEDFYDGLVDITLESDYVTVSWCYFRSHDKTMLIGASDGYTQDADDLHVTVHHCWFDATTQRHPRARFGRVHCYNNWYYNLDSYGIASVEDCQTYIENCRFENVPTLTHTTFGTSTSGKIEHSGNQIIGGGAISNTGGVFTPSSQYSYTPDVANTLMRDMLQQYAGYNTTTNLSISVSGSTFTAPLGKSYQWYKNGSSISGATNQNYTATTCGDYTVRVYGDNGCHKALTRFHATGQPAAPTISALASTSLCTGSSVTLRSSVAPASYSYQWLLNGSNISGAASRDYIATQAGSYTVKLTGSNCNSNVSSATTVTHLGDPDCNGVCGGTAVLDCNNDCGGTAFTDNCATCVGGNTGITACGNDCNGDAGGTAFIDDCGICSGGNTTHTANSDKDCNGDCFGFAFIDSCGVCSGGNSGHAADSDKDCSGTCFGNAAMDCNGICEGTSVIDSCGWCLEPGDTFFNQSCRGCDGVLNSGFEIDTCGQCLHTSNPDFNSCGSTFIAVGEKKLLLRIFPNPFRDCTSVAIHPLPDKLTFVLFDLQGKEILRIDEISNHTFKICDSRLKGMYYYRIICERQLVAAGKLLAM